MFMLVKYKPLHYKLVFSLTPVKRVCVIAKPTGLYFVQLKGK